MKLTFAFRYFLFLFVFLTFCFLALEKIVNVRSPHEFVEEKKLLLKFSEIVQFK
jgi:hypothetical protein